MDGFQRLFRNMTCKMKLKRNVLALVYAAIRIQRSLSTYELKASHRSRILCTSPSKFRVSDSNSAVGLYLISSQKGISLLY